MLEKIHDRGIIYNNLNANNILVSSPESITLINFEHSSPYFTNINKHISEDIFAVSRKDDLLALINVLNLNIKTEYY